MSGYLGELPDRRRQSAGESGYRGPERRRGRDHGARREAAVHAARAKALLGDGTSPPSALDCVEALAHAHLATFWQAEGRP